MTHRAADVYRARQVTIGSDRRAGFDDDRPARGVGDGVLSELGAFRREYAVGQLLVSAAAEAIFEIGGQRRQVMSNHVVRIFEQWQLDRQRWKPQRVEVGRRNEAIADRLDRRSRRQ